MVIGLPLAGLFITTTIQSNTLPCYASVQLVHLFVWWKSICSEYCYSTMAFGFAISPIIHDHCSIG